MLHYRTITAADDAALAKIIRTNLEQLHLDVPGRPILTRSWTT